MEKILLFQGKIDLVEGMYGKEHVFTSDSHQVRTALCRYRVRILTEEDILHLMSGKLVPFKYVRPLGGPKVDQRILSGLRLCHHDTREKLVLALKAINKLDQNFPALDHSFPVPGTVSLTTLDRWAPRVSCLCGSPCRYFLPNSQHKLFGHQC